MTEIVIPISVTNIGRSAFYECYSSTVYCEAESEPSEWYDGWNSSCPIVWNCNNNNVADDGYIYTVIDGIRYSLKDSKATVAEQPQNIVSAIIPASITYNGASYNVTSIRRYAFKNCYRLTEIIIPNSVISIDSGALSGCVNLTIYCEAESQPSVWNSSWNPWDRPVVWGHVHEYENGECVCEMKEQ